jgi:hypothetical protein
MRIAGARLFGVNALLQSMRRVKISTGVELDVAVHGDPDNPAILFLHAFLNRTAPGGINWQHFQTNIIASPPISGVIAVHQNLRRCPLIRPTS